MWLTLVSSISASCVRAVFCVCIGLGEAVLCHRGRAVPLATAHSPATNKEERERVKEAGGFISQVQIQQLKLKWKSLSLSLRMAG